MTFVQIGGYKINSDARRSQFCHFVGNISKSKTRLNHFQLKSFVDWLNFAKFRKIKLKIVSPFQFVSDQMKIIKHILQHFEVLISSTSEFNFDIRKMLFSQGLLRKHQRFLYPCSSDTK